MTTLRRTSPPCNPDEIAVSQGKYHMQAIVNVGLVFYIMP